MHELLIFLCAVGIVFFLGLQSLSVNSGHKILAAFNSFAIGSFNLFILKSVPDVESAIAIAAYLSGGPVGITLAIYTHPYIAKFLYKKGQ
jgi:hypothetical protein